MKSRFEADSFYSNNWLRLHGYAMARFCGKRKCMSVTEAAMLPFPDFQSKFRRHLKRINRK